MGRYFNEHMKHQKVWPHRTLKEMLGEVRNRRDAKEPVKHAGGRPPLEIAPNEVYDALREGLTVTEVAKKFGISRASVYKLTKLDEGRHEGRHPSYVKESELHRSTADGSIRS